MTDSSKYLSRDRAHLARLQRERRARIARIDYAPSKNALAIIKAKRGKYYPLNTNSGIIDAILIEWAGLTGTKCDELEPPKSSAFFGQYAQARMSPDSERSARAQDSGTTSGISAAIAGARPRANDFGTRPRNNAEQDTSRRIPCGARRHRDGEPCQAKSEPGKRRCRFHGGMSTGPRTPEGQKRALANLAQFRLKQRVEQKQGVIREESSEL